MKKKKKKTLFQLVREGLSDFKVKLIVLSTLFISCIAVVSLLLIDQQNDRKILKIKANKYETYIDQLLLSQFTYDELKSMGSDELKTAIDMVIEEENNRVYNTPKLNDFILPVKDSDYSTKFKLTREPKKRWSQDDLDNFWIDLDTINLEDLEERNFESLKDRLKEVR